MKKTTISLVAILLVMGSITIILNLSGLKSSFQEIEIYEILNYSSKRKPIEDVVFVSSSSPMLSLVGTPITCWYNIDGGGTEGPSAAYGLKPLLIVKDGELSLPQRRFLEYTDRDSILALGEGLSGDTVLKGTPTQISMDAAEHCYVSIAGALIVRDTLEGYELGVNAAPLASYLNIPVLVADKDTSLKRLSETLKRLNAKYVIALGENGREIASTLGLEAVLLKDTRDIRRAVMTVIQSRFGELNYVVMTNPGDVIPPATESSEKHVQSIRVNNVNVRTARVEKDIIGESVQYFTVVVPEGLRRVQIYVNFTSVSAMPLDPIKEAVEIEPIIFATLYDGEGRPTAFAPSMSFEVGKTYLETTSYNCPGRYTLEVKVHYGIRGFNTYLGTDLSISRIEATYDLTTVISELSDPHHPLFPEHSLMAPYTAAAHGGLVIAERSFEMTSEEFATKAEGYATGPWYEPALHDASNEQAEGVLRVLNETFEDLKEADLYRSYFSGPGWLSIMAGHNMLPQHYEPKDPSWEEDPIYGMGWPNDIFYSCDLKLSVGRTVAFDAGDLSALIARTLFYQEYAEAHSEKISQEYGKNERWNDHFHFLAGELGGRTGWFFWQREFAREVEQHGFVQEQYYRDKDNDRQTMLAKGAYERANYFDMMLHGNWYWYCPELNGIDEYSTAVKVTDIIKAPADWKLGPSMFISGTCLLGRIDGIPPRQSITMAFIHAGINTFFSASRSTGSEAKAGTVETTLIYDDYSVGEAWRADKMTNRDPPAFYVRNLFGDPSFNPYEPENGYSNQGRPRLRNVSMEQSNGPSSREQRKKEHLPVHFGLSQRSVFTSLLSLSPIPASIAESISHPSLNRRRICQLVRPGWISSRGASIKK